MKLIFKGLGTSGSEPCAYRFWHLRKRNTDRLTLEAVGKRGCESDGKAPGQWPWCAASTPSTQPALFRGIKLRILGRKCFSLPFPTPFPPACYSLYGFRPKWTSILPSKCQYSLLTRAVAAQLLPYGFWEPTVNIVGERRVWLILN